MGPDELDRLIDELSAGQRAAAADHADDVVAALQRVRAMPTEPLPPASRTRHLAAIRSADTARSPVRRTFRGGGLRFGRALVPVTAVAVALVLVGGGGTVALAQDVDPGHVLYPVKRGTERVWLALPRAPERAAEAHLALAERRIAEAERAPEHAEELVAQGMQNAEAAASEKPEEALATFARLLGTGPDALPAQASPRARAALYRNCLRIAAKHGLDHACPEPADLGEHPGRGPGAGRGNAGSGKPEGTPGWGPGGRPEGQVGPPPGVPRGGGGKPEGTPGWGPGGRPEGEVGPPPGVPRGGRGNAGGAEGGEPDTETDTVETDAGEADGS